MRASSALSRHGNKEKGKGPRQRKKNFATIVIRKSEMMTDPEEGSTTVEAIGALATKGFAPVCS